MMMIFFPSILYKIIILNLVLHLYTYYIFIRLPLEQTQYLDLFLHGRVHESSIRNALNEILIERGCVPVGELGKLLQEATCTVNISSRIRENLNGLKKFLENNPTDFTISTNHPYNPHVFLTRKLNADEKELILRGIVPNRYITTQNKKVSIYYSLNDDKYQRF